MLSSSPPLKRRLSPRVPTPQELARLFKRPRLDAPPTPSNIHSKPPGQHLMVNMSAPSLPSQTFAPALHSIPHGAVPILEAPYTVADFFSDVAPQGPHASAQHVTSAKTFPPPMPPPTSLLADAGDGPGVMVPFVYPALPALHYDPWTVYPEGIFEAEQRQHAKDRNPGVHKRPRRRLAESDSKMSWDDSNEKEDRPDAPSGLAYPVIAPLPFPPANFMPYPILADRAPLTPHDVFTSWIDASKHLPRVDMVLASAAGSIYDLHSQATAEGLDSSKLDELLRLGCLDQDSTSRSTRLADDSALADYLTYASNVDTTTVQDPYAKPISGNYVVVPSDSRIRALKVHQRTSKDGVDVLDPPDPEPTEPNYSGEIPRFEFPFSKDLVVATGVQRSRRRQVLAKMVAELEDHAQTNREQIYAQKRNQLLARLKSLRNCNITFANDPSQIPDTELRDFAEKRQAQRDEELVRLKVTHNYEKLKNVLSFYQTSHRSYKAMNATMVNKLQKLRNFMEHQRQILSTAARNVDADAKNMRSRESEKIYSGFVEQEYGNEIKEEFRSVIASEDGKPLDQNKTFDASLFQKVYKGHTHSAMVEDYMPLVTKAEFKLITGDAPAKTVSKDAGNKGKSARHQIFQSMLYDRATSGSDTDSPTVKRRPGRRAAPKPTYGEEAKVNNDAALVAKIMKQFVGPGAANADELIQDLDSIGIKTKWPVK